MPSPAARRPFRFRIKPGWTLSLTLGGLALATALVGVFGFHIVAREVFSIGARGFAIVCAWQCVLFAGLGAAWAAVLPPRVRRPGWRFVWARAVRDSTATCLPFTQAGGFVTGIRSAVLLGVPWQAATASNAIDLACEFLAELVLITAGLVLLLLHRPGSPWVWSVLGGLVVALPVALGFLWLQSRGNLRFTRLAARMLRVLHVEAGGQLDRVRAALDALYAEPRRIVASFLLHLCNWFGATVATWLAYTLLGSRMSLSHAVAIEGLVHAAMIAGVMIPAHAGVQEAGYVAVGSLFGQKPAVSLAVSLLMRARDLAVGLPILLTWQAQEWRVRRVRDTVVS